MCGLAGGFGRDLNPQVIRTLLILNESRGKDATGMFDATGWWTKVADEATNWLQQPRTGENIAKMCSTGAICCHTRGASSWKGKGLVNNAHPFVYGPEDQEVTLAHNGILDAPATYDVDSMFAADKLSQSPPGDYQAALGDVVGWYVLTWHDKRDGHIYLLNWLGSLCFAMVGKKTIYYSSSPEHLRIALGGPVWRVTKDNGEVWVWDGQRLRQTKKFTGQKRVVVHYSNSQWTAENCELFGSINKKFGLWYAVSRGNRYFLLKDQAKWDRLYPRYDNQPTSYYVFPRDRHLPLTDDDVLWSSAVFWDGKPAPGRDGYECGPKKKLADDTELEPSEIGDASVVSTTTPGVADGVGRVVDQVLREAGVVTDYGAAEQALLVGTEEPSRAMQAIELQAAIDRLKLEGLDADQRRVLRNCVLAKERNRLLADGWNEDAIEEELWRNGFYDYESDKLPEPHIAGLVRY